MSATLAALLAAPLAALLLFPRTVVGILGMLWSLPGAVPVLAATLVAFLALRARPPAERTAQQARLYREAASPSL